MWRLSRLISLRHLLSQQLPAVAISFLVAELFYKFHSFTLECLAFLTTWYVLDMLLYFLFSQFGPSKTASQPGEARGR
jgi:hypothetical protein